MGRVLDHLLKASTRDTLLGALNQGLSRKAACGRARVPMRTFNHALRVGRQLVAEEECWQDRSSDDVEYQCAQFLLDVEASEATAEAEALGHWRAGMDRDWRAAENFVKRRYPQAWGDRQVVEVDDVRDPDDGFDISKLSTEEQVLYERLTHKAYGEGAGSDDSEPPA